MLQVEAYRRFSSDPTEKMSSSFARRNRRSDSDVEAVMWSANVETPEMSESQNGHLELSSVDDATILRNFLRNKASDLVLRMPLSRAMSHSLGPDMSLDKAQRLVC